MRPLDDLARLVDDAAVTRTPIPQLTDSFGDLAVDDAYAIQTRSLARRYARGERRIGVKLGLTSIAKMKQVGVDEVIWGRLTDAMLIEAGTSFSTSRFIHPRVEPEIVFRIGSPLSGDVSEEEALAAVDGIAPALEVIDSRYRNFKFRLADVIADNSSSAGLVIGGWLPPATDISDLAMVLSVNGRPVETGSSAAILGHPIRSLVAAARLVARYGERIEPGDIVMAGGATAAWSVSPGETISLDVESMGPLSIRVEA